MRQYKQLLTSAALNGLPVVLISFLLGGFFWWQAVWAIALVAYVSMVHAVWERNQTALTFFQPDSLFSWALGSHALIAMSVYVGFAGGLGFDLLHVPEWAAGVCLVAGFVLTGLSIAQLGRNFSPVILLYADHQLVTTGFYRYIRHPRYLGAVLFQCGLCLIADQPEAIGFVLVWVLTFVLGRCNAEDEMLRERFGVLWTQWAARTRRLIPLVW